MKKTIILSISTVATLSCILYCIMNGFGYYQTMTGMVIDKYTFDNTSKYGTHKEMVLIVKYPKITLEKHVFADTFYNTIVGDNITFEEKVGENKYSYGLMLVGCLLFVFTVIFSATLLSNTKY